MIKVLIVEDSPVAQEFLTGILASDPEIDVVGISNNGVEALKDVKKKCPDVITMDIHMPIMDGYEATRQIMETHPTPIVIVSASASVTEVASIFQAVEAGALAVVLRPPAITHKEFDAASKELVETVKLMSEIKVVRRINRSRKLNVFTPLTIKQLPEEKKEVQIVAIGSSTGGPPVLQKILSGLPNDLPFSILIVQHIAAGFVGGFVEWLANTSHFPIHIAVHDESPLPGHAYVAPDGYHMGVGMGSRIVLSKHEPENGLRPSVGFLFRSVAQFIRSGAVGVLLTGMGRDGAEELKKMKDNGAITIAQDENSSVVHGMPGEAIKLGAAMYILPPEGITGLLATLAKKTNER